MHQKKEGLRQQKSKKNVAVLFSSGLDSTYLMYKNLEEGNRVYPIYIEIKNNENKSKVEKQAVRMLCKVFTKKYGHDYIESPKFVTEILVNGRPDLLLQQLPLWIFGMMYTDLLSYDEIQIAYVANDDALSYLSEIKKLYNSYKWIVHNGKLPKLKFPLTKTTKREMMDELPDEYRNFISSCENPELKPYHIKLNDLRMQFFEPCGECVPCQRIINDGLGYNTIYGKMIAAHYDRQSIGNRFHRIKENEPETFKKIEDVLYGDWKVKAE